MTPADLIPLGFAEVFILSLAAGCGLALGVFVALGLSVRLAAWWYGRRKN